MEENKKIEDYKNGFITEEALDKIAGGDIDKAKLKARFKKYGIPILSAVGAAAIALPIGAALGIGGTLGVQALKEKRMDNSVFGNLFDEE